MAPDTIALPGRDYYLDERENEVILHKIGPGLKKLYLEPTGRCNLNCITCMRQTWPSSPEGEMSMELFENLLRQLTCFPGLNKVHLGGYGEPLAHSRALDLIGMLSAAGLRVSINTNGTLVTPEVSRELVRAGVQAIYFSIDGLDSNSYGEVRVNGELEAVLDNIRALRDIKKELKINYPKIGLEFVLMRRNADQLKKLAGLAKELKSPEVLVSNLLAHSEEMYGEVLYETPGKQRDMGAGVIAPLQWAKEPDNFRFPEPLIWPAVEQDYVLWGTMRLPRMYWGSGRRCSFVENDAAVIRHDGEVSPCLALLYSYPYILDNRRKEVSAYSLGNIEEQDLYTIWNNPEYLRFRYRVKNYRFPSCMDCSTNKSCDYTEANEDCWGNSPSCADCLWSQGIVRCP